MSSGSSKTLTAKTEITAAKLEKMLNEAPSGATVKLAAGDYVFDDSITITRSDVSLAGAGSDATTITFTDEALDNDNDHGLYVQGEDAHFVGSLKNDADDNDRTLSLKGSHELEVGDTVRIWQDNDRDFFDLIGDRSWQKDNAPLRTSMAQVESVHGNEVTLDRGVHFDFEGGEAKVERIDAVENVTLEGFTVEYELGTPDSADFSNTRSGLKDYHAVEFNGTVDSEISDVQVINGPSVAFEIALSLDIEADELGAHGSFNKGSGGNGYGYELRESYDGTFTQLEDSGMRHGVLFASWRSSVGNDIQVTSTDRDINFHGGQDHDNTVRVEQSVRDAEADKMSPSLWINLGGESFGAITGNDANDVTFEYVVGSRRDDEIQGADNGVYLNGGLGDDILRGGDGDDILQGGPEGDWGDDTIDGGDGDDTALYQQDYDKDDVSFKNGKVIVEKSSGKDTLDDVEQVVFGDGTVLDVDSRDTSHGKKLQIPKASEIIDSEDSAFVKGSSSSSDDKSKDDDEDEDEQSSAKLASMKSEEKSEKASAKSSEDNETEENSSDSDASSQDDSASLEITAHLETLSHWQSGYVMSVEIANASDEDMDDALVSFELDANISRLKGASLVSQDDDTYTFELDDNFAAGSSQSFLFKAETSGNELLDSMTISDGGSNDIDVELLGLSALDSFI
ncbi:alginate biosynthesis protein [Halomonas sp. WWR20]